MYDFQEQSRVRSFFASRTVLIVLLLLLLGMGIITFQALEAGWSAQAERAAVKEHLRDLEEQKTTLTSELEELRSQEGIEREARQKLNFRKPGEEVVIIREMSSVSSQNDAANISFWESLKKWFSEIVN